MKEVLPHCLVNNLSLNIIVINTHNTIFGSKWDLRHWVLPSINGGWQQHTLQMEAIRVAARHPSDNE